MELRPFKKVYGVDPSGAMNEVAQNHITQSSGFPGQLEFIQSKAEELPFLKDGEVDLIVAGPQRCSPT